MSVETEDQQMLVLFPVARGTDPWTSKFAASMIDAKRPTQMLMVLRAFSEGDLTDEQAAEVTGIKGGWKRCADLRNAGLIEPTGRTLIGHAGMPVMVSRITESGHHVLSKTRADWSQGLLRRRGVAVAGEAQEVGPPVQSEADRRYDEGWQEGYDAGIDSPSNPRAVQAYYEGTGLGRKEMARQVLTLVERMRVEMAKHRGQMLVHTDRCWLEHPRCAIEAIEKQAKRVLETE